jgi:hypothetical protein
MEGSEKDACQRTSEATTIGDRLFRVFRSQTFGHPKSVAPDFERLGEGVREHPDHKCLSFA